MPFARRGALDGLRGVFSLQVVLFHLDAVWFKQGFVGVDGFFVLSGFLITSMIIHETISSQAFSYSRFYARRTKRLLPSSLLVLVLTAWCYRTIAAPALITEHRGAFLAGASYIENWYLVMKEHNYFSQTAGDSPILHYRSLAVEEQFYMFWPLVVVSLLSWSSFKTTYVAHGCLFAFFVSLGLQYFNSGLSLEQRYYATPMRIYQLLGGAFLGVILKATMDVLDSGSLPPSLVTKPLKAQGFGLCFGGLLGVLLLSTGLMPVDPTNAGFMCTFFTLVLIVGLELDDNSLPAKLLKSSLLQFLGKHSYAIYLWHFPVIRIGRMLAMIHTDVSSIIVVLLITIFLAWLTYLCVDRPIHSLSLSDSVTIGLGMLATFVAFSVIFIGFFPMQAPFNDSTTELKPILEPTTPESDELHLQILRPQPGELSTPQVRIEPKNRIMLLGGDSFAREWSDVWQQLAFEYKCKAMIRCTDRCPWFHLEYQMAGAGSANP